MNPDGVTVQVSGRFQFGRQVSGCLGIIQEGAQVGSVLPRLGLSGGVDVDDLATLGAFSGGATWWGGGGAMALI